MPDVIKEDNEDYISEKCESVKECLIDTTDIFPIHEHPLLPDWLKLQTEMIFPHRCIEKHQMIGRGQYGVVFKGKITVGNSVYVFTFLLRCGITILCYLIKINIWLFTIISYFYQISNCYQNFSKCGSRGI